MKIIEEAHGLSVQRILAHVLNQEDIRQKSVKKSVVYAKDQVTGRSFSGPFYPRSDSDTGSRRRSSC